MSRHTLTARADRYDVGLVVVGWDRPLETFFVQVHRARGGPMLVWRGAKRRDIRTAAGAIVAVERFAVVPVGLEEQLEREQRSTAGERDGPAQRAMRDALR